MEGRQHLNFSEWPARDNREAAHTVEEGEMPPLQYTMLHPDARLSDQQVRDLADGLRRIMPGSE